MPVPFPDVERAAAITHEHPVKRKRALVRWLAKCWVNRVIAIFNFYDLGGEAFKQVHKLRHQPLSQIQKQYTNQLVDDLLRWIHLPTGQAMLRSGGRCAKFKNCMDRVARQGYSEFGNVSAFTSSALDVCPDRVSLPKVAGGVKPEDFLPEPLRSQYLNIEARQLPPHLWPELPKSCHKVHKDDELRFLYKLHECDMGVWKVEREVFVTDPDGKRIVISGGFFAVPHKELSDRLIYDRRMGNAVQVRLMGWARLPHGTSLTQLIIKKGHTIRGSLDDLRCMFYCLAQPPKAHKYNVVARRWKGRDLIKIGYDIGEPIKPNEWYRFCLSVQGMGDSNAVDIAQRTHEGILHVHNCLPESCTMHYDESFPESDTITGIYVDDKLVAQQNIPIKDIMNMDYEDVQLVERGERAYEDVPGLEQAIEKRIRYKERFTAWGTEVLGRQGFAECPAPKRALIASCCSVVVRKGRCDKKSLEQVVGSFVHPFQHKKRLMCVFSEVYKFIHSIHYGKSYALPGPVLSELIAATLLMPFASANIRWDVSSLVSCTDATPSDFGGCRAELDLPTIRKLYRLAEHRGEYVRMDWNGPQENLHPTRMKKPQEHIEALVESLDWYITAEAVFVRIHHVNVQELEALIHEVKMRAIIHRGAGCRVVCFVDSRVVCGAWSKGRSSSRMLNRRIRQALGYELLGRIQVVLIWIGTHHNPSDDPSRHAALRAPIPLSTSEQAFWQKAGVSNAVGIADESDLCERVPIVPNAPVAPKSTSCDFAVLTEDPMYIDMPEDRSSSSSTTTLSNSFSTTSQNSHHNISREEFVKIMISHGIVSTDVLEHAWNIYVGGPYDLVEFFSGHGGLSSSARKLGLSAYEIEAYMNNKPYNRLQDLDIVEIQNMWIVLAILKTFKWGHFGIVCRTWGSLHMMFNGGTRTRAQPLGDGSRDDERSANLSVAWMCRMIKLMRPNGIEVTIENPARSLIYFHPDFLEVINLHELHFHYVDQCQYGLCSPAGSAQREIWKKPTYIVTSFKECPNLERRCTGQHTHVCIKGCIRVLGRSVARSLLAGRYPARLCTSIVKSYIHNSSHGKDSKEGNFAVDRI